MRLLVILLAGAATALICDPCHAQVLRGGKVQPRRPGGTQVREVEIDGGNRRNDLEGTIWEYKVMENSEKDRSRRTKMTGQIRIKQSALFAISRVVVSDDKEKDDKKEKEAEGSSSLPRGTVRERLLAGRTEAGVNEGDKLSGKLSAFRAGRGPTAIGHPGAAPERVGDLVIEESNEYTFRFDEDDSYPLSGRASLKPDTTNRGGVMIGNYDEFVHGKKKKRWRIEMRKVEE